MNLTRNVKIQQNRKEMKPFETQLCHFKTSILIIGLMYLSFKGKILSILNLGISMGHLTNPLQLWSPGKQICFTPIKLALGGMRVVALIINSHEQTQ